MERFIRDQIVYGLKYLPANLAKSAFVKKNSDETKALRRREFLCGVCHPNKNYRQIKEANIGWIRIDIPFPYNADGSICDAYLGFKKRAKAYQDNGIKVMAVTPYPKDYIAFGADIRTEDGEKQVREIARFIIGDLQGYISGLQITNEMGIPHFTLPLNMDEAAKFIGVQLYEMHCRRGDVIIGYNSAGPQADLHCRMKKYLKFCDYVGIDIYIGCFFNAGGFMWFFDALLDYLWAYTGKPILIQEFGYLSGGHPKTKAEKLEILQKYGASSEKDAKENIVSFVEHLPEHFKRHVKYVCNNDESRYYDLIFKSDIINHLYCELPAMTKIPGYDHTPEGQAAFFDEMLFRLYQKEFVAGAFIYCYQDPQSCHICGQSDCPTETRWGLVDRQGEPKPSYYAVKNAFGRIKWYRITEKQ